MASRKAVNGGLLAFTGRAPEGSELGRVIDVSAGGLSFEYVADRPLPDGSFILHLTPPQKTLQMRDLPVVTVSDVATGETAPYSNISVRRRGLKFEDFSVCQRMKLRWLVHRCNTL